MRHLLAALCFCAFATTASAQQTYSFTGLSTDDLLTIGHGLDKLPREETDKNNLYARLQAQITKQNQDWAKAQAEAKKKELDDAVKAATAPKADQQ